MKLLFTTVWPATRTWLAICAIALAGQYANAQSSVQATVQPDASFGSSGSTGVGLAGVGGPFTLTYPAQPAREYNMGQMVLANGHLWACGGTSGSFVVKGYLADGQPDPAFGANGTLTIAVPYAADARTLMMQPDGKLVAAGAAHGLVTDAPVLARFSQTGVLDATFGTGGIVASDPNAGTSPSLGLQQLVILTNGNLLGVGTTISGGGNARMMCLLPNGQPNTSFNNGTAYTSLVDIMVHQMLLQADGRVLLVGMGPGGASGTPTYLHNPAAIVRLTATGQPDTTFGTNGLVLINGTQTSSGTTSVAYTEGFGIDVQPTDGKILVVGRVHYDATISVGNMPVLLRLNANGTPDAAFNTAADRTLYNTGGLTTVAAQADGTILVGGAYQALNATAAQPLLARYTAAGALDGTFNPASIGINFVPAGVYLSPPTSGHGAVGQLLVQPDGKILTLGGFDLLGSQANGLRLSRYQLNRPTATLAPGVAVLQLQASPVPSSGMVYLRYTLPTVEVAQLTLHDQLGRQVAKSSAKQQIGLQEQTIDLTNLATGVYFCTLEAGALRHTVRLVVAP